MGMGCEVYTPRPGLNPARGAEQAQLTETGSDSFSSSNSDGGQRRSEGQP
jgi:hypothetical protein